MAERQYDIPIGRSCVIDELRPLIEMYDLSINNEQIVIPPKPDYGVLYNDGKIRFDDITEITADLTFIKIHIRDGYLFSFYRQEPLITCIRETSL